MAGDVPTLPDSGRFEQKCCMVDSWMVKLEIGEIRSGRNILQEHILNASDGRRSSWSERKEKVWVNFVMDACEHSSMQTSAHSPYILLSTVPILSRPKFVMSCTSI